MINNLIQECSYYNFDEIECVFKQLYIYHYIALYNNSEIIDFTIQCENINVIIAITDFKNNFKSYEYNIKNEKNIKLTGGEYIYIIQKNENNLQFISKPILIKIINKEKLCVRDINNNIIINNIGEPIKIINNIYDNMIDYNFKNYEEKILYNMDLVLFNNLNEKYKNNEYFTLFDRFLISYK